jgi:hypothetical protein
MFIVPLSPALFANRLLIDQTSHLRCSAHLPPLCCCQLSSDLLSVAHLTVSPRCQPKTHPFLGTLLCSHTCSAFVLHSYFHLLLWTMANTIRMALQAEEAFLTITQLERTCLHVARSLARYSIPVKANAVVQKRYPKINLEIMAAPMGLKLHKNHNLNHFAPTHILLRRLCPQPPDPYEKLRLSAFSMCY